MTRAKPIVRLKDPKRFLIPWQKQQIIQFPTYAATEDDVLTSLLFRLELVTLKDNNGNRTRKTIAKKYNRQALDIILHHSKTGQVKDFIIKESDLMRRAREELTNKRIGGTPEEYFKIIDDIFTNAVRRIFEEIDLVYYHEHLADKLVVRITP
jgi:hypothetical protein